MGELVTKARFMEKTSEDKNTKCWNWIGAKRGNYGTFTYKGNLLLAHRVSWMIFVGEIENNALVCHKCDNPLCVNPEHLYLGDYKTNGQDKVDRGRTNAIKDEYIIGLINDYNSGVSSKEIAEKYSINRTYTEIILIWYRRFKRLKIL